MLTIRIAALGPRLVELGPATPSLRVGRDPGNELCVNDPSLSRRHGVFTWEGGRAWFEDMGSHNGSRLNGRVLAGRTAIGPSDQLELGDVRVALGGPPPTVGEGSSQLFPLGQVRRDFPSMDSHGGKRVEETLTLLQELSMDLLRDDAQEAQLARVLDHLWPALEPRRLVILLKGKDGELAPRASLPPSREELPVSRTAVASICASHQALLIQDRGLDPRLKDAPSLVAMAVTSLMAVPMECEGQVEGLLYAEAGLRRQPFDKRDLALLATVAHLLAARVRTSRLLQEREKARVMDREMAIARQMQRHLLPAQDPVAPGFQFLGQSIPSLQVSGDLYGYWQPSARRRYAAIADVAGKGAGPGLLMACLVAYMNAFTQGHPSTAELATQLSACLAQHTTLNRYATAFLCCLDPEAGWLEYTNAGHNPGLLVRRDGRVERLGAKSFPLAMFPGRIPYVTERAELEVGDLLFLFTDGITEAADAQGEEYGLERLEAFLVEHRALPLEALVTALQASLDALVGGVSFGDDRTLLAVRRTGVEAGHGH